MSDQQPAADPGDPLNTDTLRRRIARYLLDQTATNHDAAVDRALLRAAVLTEPGRSAVYTAAAVAKRDRRGKSGASRGNNGTNWVRTVLRHFEQQGLIRRVGNKVYVDDRELLQLVADGLIHPTITGA